jgi:hypothetical protein
MLVPASKTVPNFTSEIPPHLPRVLFRFAQESPTTLDFHFDPFEKSRCTDPQHTGDVKEGVDRRRFQPSFKLGNERPMQVCPKTKFLLRKTLLGSQSFQGLRKRFSQHAPVVKALTRVRYSP